MMNWSDVHSEYSQFEKTWTVMRPAFVMEFYGEGQKLAPFGTSILERFFRYVPPGCQFYFLGNNSREYRLLDNRSSRRLFKTLEELEKRERSYFIKDAPEFDAGNYAIEMSLGSRHSMINDSVIISLPLESADDGTIADTIAMFTDFVSSFPFWAGVAGYGYNLVWGREFEMVGMPAQMRSALRFHGILVRDRTQETYAVKKLKSAGWLTFMDAEFMQPIGGANTLLKSISGLVNASAVRDGLLLIAGARPPVGDVNKQDQDVLPMAALNRAISSRLVEKWIGDQFDLSPEIANGWLKRFE